MAYSIGTSGTGNSELKKACTRKSLKEQEFGTCRWVMERKGLWLSPYSGRYCCRCFGIYLYEQSTLHGSQIARLSPFIILTGPIPGGDWTLSLCVCSYTAAHGRFYTQRAPHTTQKCYFTPHIGRRPVVHTHIVIWGP